MTLSQETGTIMLPQDRYLTLKGEKIRYWDEGTGPKTLVFVHGLASNVHYWQKTVPMLSQHYRVLALDLLGFGASSKPRARYDHLFLIQCLKDFLDELKVKSCVLVGHSMGGGIALEFAADYPAYVEKLVLVSSAGFCRTLPFVYSLISLPAVGELMMRPHSVEVAGKFVRRFAYRKDQISDDFVREIHRHHQTKDYFSAFLSVIRNHIDITGIKNSVLKLTRAHTPLLKMPVLVVWGKEDELLPIKNAYRAVELIPQAELHIFDACGHMPQLEHPEKFNQILLDFMHQ
jgi:4,5:9,10-diseco-3-hydroxy-5,9,17-trioxoandrosta-1(10),2-diene-4-oate hydrolase